jgi:hypothetical protein
VHQFCTFSFDHYVVCSSIYGFWLRKIWRYQRGNQNPYIEEEQTTQWPKEKVQKDKQRSTKHIYKTINNVRFQFPSRCLREDSCLIYALCVCLSIVVSDTYCDVFCLVFMNECKQNRKNWTHIVTRSLVLYICFVLKENESTSYEIPNYGWNCKTEGKGKKIPLESVHQFCTFSFDHYVVCSSSIYGLWLPIWHLQTILTGQKLQWQ